MIKIELTKQQFQALCGLIDVGIRGTGLRSVKDAAEIMAVLDAALVEAQKPKVAEKKIIQPTYENSHIPANGMHSDSDVHLGVECGSNGEASPSP